MKNKTRKPLNITDVILMFFFGYCELFVKSGYERALSVIFERKLRFTHMRNVDGGISFRIYLFRRKQLLFALSKEDAEFSCGKAQGLPAILLSVVKKKGLALGLISLLAITLISERVIWEISITGTKELLDSEILADLEEHGIKLGTRISSLDIDQICTDYLIENPSLSWIRINAIGNCLQVVVKEKDIVPSAEGDRPSNLVADCDGLIYRVETISGQRLVSGGESVLKGQILVSGLVENQDPNIEGVIIENPTYRFERSIGKVFAITDETLTVEIPMIYTEKRYTGEIYEKKSLIFFSNSINFSFLGRNLYENCDIMNVYDHITLPNGKILPVSVKNTLYKEYVTEEIPLTEKEAARLAESTLAEKIASLIGEEGVLLSKSISASCDGDLYKIECKISCIRDIGVETPLFSADK